MILIIIVIDQNVNVRIIDDLIDQIGQVDLIVINHIHNAIEKIFILVDKHLIVTFMVNANIHIKDFILAIKKTKDWLLMTTVEVNYID